MTTDYDAIRRTLSLDPTLKHAITFAPGIRILRQDPWEALCCFIISQNNNIKRIKGIVQRLCSCPWRADSFQRLLFLSFPSAISCCHIGGTGATALRLSCQIPAGCCPACQQRTGAAGCHSADAAGAGARPSDADCRRRSQGRRLCFALRIPSAGVLPDGCLDEAGVCRTLSQRLPDCAQDFIGIAQQYLFHYVRCCPQILEAPEKEAALV